MRSGTNGSRIVRFAAIASFLLAAGLFLLGVWAWPPGGLMFALPYFFLLPAAGLLLLGLILLIVSRIGRSPSWMARDDTKNNR
jgi:hypothetical protein